MHQFEDLRASEIYCPRCRVARPVRERLLLVLPHAELYDYRCAACGTSVAQREVKAPPLRVAAAPARRPAVPPARSPPRPAAGALPAHPRARRA